MSDTTDTQTSANRSAEKEDPISEDLLIHVGKGSQRPTVEWSEKLYDRIMDEVGDKLYHDRELSIVGQGVDEEIFVICPEPRGNPVYVALKRIGFEPKHVENDSPRTVFRIESNMEVTDGL